MSKTKELPIPPAVLEAEQALEIARVWGADGEQHVTLAGELWDDPAAWGLVLVDLARHVANAYEQGSGREVNEVLERIREAFDAEWDSPTDQPTGTIET
ncbi:MAG: DUF5076 domain-containing protein [Myxococcota bacterium]